jgi:hypothetical protein
VARLLLQHGAKPNQRNDSGQTALGFAANAGDVALVDLLLRHGADINGGTAWTPLMDAAYNGWEEVVKLLIRKGADVNFHPRGYMTPLECAQGQGHTSIVAMLRRAGGKGRSPAAMRRAMDQAAKALKAQLARQQPPGRDQELTPEDQQVIETVLLDLLAYKGKDLFLLTEPVDRIILVDRTSQSRGLLMDDQLNSELDERQANDVSLAIRDYLAQRNSSPVSLAGFKSTAPTILLRSEEEARAIFAGAVHPAPEARAWVQVYLPGYSPERDRAVLRFAFGPTPHGAAGTYYLRKQEGVWRVEWRHFAIFV